MPENFAVVGDFLREGEPTGAGRYSARLLDVLAAAEGVGRVVVVVPGEPAEWVRTRFWPDKLEWVYEPARPLWLYRSFLPTVAATGSTRLLYPASLPLFPFPGTATVVHDLGFTHAPDAYSSAFAGRQRMSWLLSDTLIVTSHAVRDELRAEMRFPGEIVVVPPVLGGPVSAGPGTGCRAEAGDRYVLMLGQWRWNKNWEVLSRAMECPLWPQGIDLVIAGADSTAVEKYFPPGRGRRGAIRSLGYVSDARLRTLWERTLALVMPSIYEGFGVPVIEAAAQGVPVVCSAIPVFREALSGCGLYFSVDSGSELAATVAQAVCAAPQVRDVWATRLRRVAARYTLTAAAGAVERWLGASASGWESA